MEKYTKEVEELLSQLTLEEKITIIHAAGFFKSGEVERLGIPSIMTSDGPCGVRNDFQNDTWFPLGRDDDFVSYLPSGSAIASTWNTELAYEVGQVLGEEARGRGKDMILAPGINVKRDPRCGRNFEYMSEDPKAIEKFCVPYIKGAQESDVSVCVKHYAVNNQESNRLANDSRVDERTLREIYLPAFKAAVQEGGALSIMGAYNKFRGQHCCHNEYLINEVLRKDWGFDGVFVSDWGGVHDTMEAANTGLDLEMSVTPDFDDYFMANPLLEAVKEGKVSEEIVDEKVRNILRLMFRIKMLGDTENRKSGTYNTPEHREIVYNTALESIVLLKNDKKILPLNKKKLKKIAVIGANASVRHSLGGGSAEIKALYEIAPLMGLEMRLGGNTKVEYSEGYYVPSKAMNATENWQASSTEEVEELELQYPYIKYPKKGQYKEENEKRYEEALRIAKDADAVIFFGGLDHNYDVEGADRPTMELPYEQDIIIEKLLEVRPDMIISLTAGSPVEMPWIDKASTVIWNYYAGMETGTALADVLLGNSIPSGKLSESMPYKYEDTVTFANKEFGRPEYTEYLEGIFYGYRYYEKENKKVMFPFGYGLGYAEAEYYDMEASVKDDELKIKLKVKNLSDEYLLDEAVQVYVGENNPTVERPVKELKGFAKVMVKPQDREKVEIIIKTSELGYYDVDKKDFVTNPGEYTVYIGASSQDIRGKIVVTL